MRHAIIVKVPCGYFIAPIPSGRPRVEYTETDLAWFRHPIKES